MLAVVVLGVLMVGSFSMFVHYFTVARRAELMSDMLVSKALRPKGIRSWDMPRAAQPVTEDDIVTNTDSQFTLKEVG